MTPGCDMATLPLQAGREGCIRSTAPHTQQHCTFTFATKSLRSQLTG